MNAPIDPVYLRRATETEVMRALRKRVDKARARCLGRAERASCHDSGMFMLRASQIASAWVWAPATQPQLEDVITLLAALNVAANAAERLESSDGN